MHAHGRESERVRKIKECEFTLQAAKTSSDEVLATRGPDNGVGRNLLVAMHLRQLAFDVPVDLESDARCLSHEDRKLAPNGLKRDILNLLLDLHRLKERHAHARVA